jgi:hypothetical protein
MTRRQLTAEEARRNLRLAAIIREQGIARAALSVVERADATGETLEAAASGFLLGQPDSDLTTYVDILAQARSYDRQAGPPYAREQER